MAVILILVYDIVRIVLSLVRHIIPGHNARTMHIGRMAADEKGSLQIWV